MTVKHPSKKPETSYLPTFIQLSKSGDWRVVLQSRSYPGCWAVLRGTDELTGYSNITVQVRDDGVEGSFNLKTFLREHWNLTSARLIRDWSQEYSERETLHS